MAKKKGKGNENYFPFNQRLDRQLIDAHEYEVHKPFAMRCLSQYIEDVELRQMGMSLEEIGIKQRRDSITSLIYSQSAKRLGTVEDYFDDENDGSAFESDSPNIAIVQLVGMMRMEDGLSQRGIRSTCNEMSRLCHDEGIGAMIIDVNTGGGEKIAGQHFFNTVLDISQHIPVFAFGHFIASAGVRGTLPCVETWMAGYSAMYGSIGTMTQVNKDFAKWYNKNVDEIYSRKSPKKNHEWREMLSGRKGAILDKLDVATSDFHDAVKKYRKLNPAMEADTLMGDVFPAKEAIERGLVTGIGTLNTVIERAVEYINNPSLNKSTMEKKDFEALKAELERVHGTKFEATNAKDLTEKIKEMKPVSETVKEAETAVSDKAKKDYDEKLEQVTNKMSEKLDSMEKSKKDKKEDTAEEKTEAEKKYDALMARMDKFEEENKDLKKENKTLKQEKAKDKAKTESSKSETSTQAPQAVKDLEEGFKTKGTTKIEVEF